MRKPAMLCRREHETFQEFSGFATTRFSRGLPTSKLFVASGQEELKARLTFLVRERGVSPITGGIGWGRPTAVRAFVDERDPTRVTVVYAVNSLIGIAGRYREMLRQQMVFALGRCCDVSTHERKKTPVLIVEEAYLLD